MSLTNNSLFARTLATIANKRNRLLEGKINCIPWGLPRFEEQNPGIEQGKYYLVTANSKVGKTQITDALFLYNIAQQLIDNLIDIRFKLFYFTLEMSSEEKMLACFANILYVKEGLRISPTDLKSTKADKILPEDVLAIIQKYEPYFNKIEEFVEFIDSVRHPYGIYNLVRKYALANGTVVNKQIVIDGEVTEVEDYYQPNDPDEYVMVIVDHIGLIASEKRNGVQLSLHESISVLSSDYLLKLRNRFNYIPVVVQQQSQAQESIENKKHNKLKPSLDGLGDNKLTQRDANVILGLFSPFRHEIPDYFGYDITRFKDNIRFLEILGGRDGGAGTVCPLYFDGAVNFFKELPLPNDAATMKSVYNILDRKNNNK
jgi:replicative DNA helicase